MDQSQSSNTAGVMNYGVISREQRRQILGLDCAEMLEWRHWQPGTEHSRTLVLKNIGTTAVKLRYKQTANKAFSMDFPEPIKLRPGMSHPLKVMFRPLRLQQYSDVIEIECNAATFQVPVQAYTPALRVEVPGSLDFAFVATLESATLPLTIRNTGDVKVTASWKLEAPFTISPATATLNPGQCYMFEVAFKPTEACSYDASAYCQFDSGSSAVVQITGIGKFPYMTIEQPTIDFGSLLVGKSTERLFRCGNHSAVPAHFTIAHASGAEDGVFTISPMRGTLGPNEFTLLRATYTPRHSGTFSAENFTLSTPGGNKVSLSLRGEAAAPVVTFSTRALNFGNVPAGQPSSRVLYIQNASDVAVAYDFQVDPGDVFSVSSAKGSVAARTTGHVQVTFSASTPANFWRRIVCLIKDADPLGLDLLATCYDDKSRPPPLSHRHVTGYLARIAAGGPPITDDSNGTAADGNGEAPAAAAAAALGSTAAWEKGGGMDAAVADTAGAQVAFPGPDSWSLLFDGADPARAVTLDVTSLDFGTCARLSAGEVKSVVVMNRTSARLSAFFTVPLWQDATGSAPPVPVFQVFPESADLKPNGSTTFRVAFRPPRDGQFYSQTLCLVAAVKAMRSFRLVADHQVVPPWSVPLLASGNTFLHSHPEHAPKVEISHTSIAFPPCRVGEVVHQTLQLVNYGDTPAHFSIAEPTLGQLFQVKPARGVVPPKGQVLLGLRFSPQDDRPAAAKALLLLNNIATNAVELLLTGSAHTPRVAFDISGTLYFRPTCVGASSQRTLTVHNPSRVPVAFAWQLPKKAEGIISVSPITGILRGNESMATTWNFVPGAQKTVEFRAACLLLQPSAVQGFTLPETGSTDAPATESVPLTLVGEGTQGAIALDPPELDLGSLMVGYPVKRTVSLINQSDGVLRYSLDCSVSPDGLDELPESDSTSIDFTAISAATAATAPIPPFPDCELWVDDPDGVIPAKASKIVTVTFWPRYRKRYSLQLACRTSSMAPLAAVRPPSGGNGRPMGGTAGAAAAMAGSGGTEVCAAVRAQVTFPSLHVCDVHADGRGKASLWQMLSASEVNVALASGVTALEMALGRMEDLGTLTTATACKALRPYTLDFGTVALGGAPVVISVQLRNDGMLPASWELHSYDDPELELENWVEAARPIGEVEKARDFITEHKLFDVRPRSGTLPPGGGTTTVTLQYKPCFAGEYQLPMFLHVADGKRIWLQLRGVTAPEEASKQELLLLPTHRTFVLQPVPIGEIAPPQQSYSLCNGGPEPLSYSLDLAPVLAMQRSNWGYDVLRLASACEGWIQPGSFALLNWVFSPLEAKTYTLEVPVTLGDGSSEVITLQGRGFHPSSPSSSQPDEGEGNRQWDLWPGFTTVPSAGMASRLAVLSQDVLSLGTTLLRGVTRRVLVLTNKSRYPLLFSWDLGALAGPEVHARTTISPAQGSLDPGERAVVRLSLVAGLIPHLLDNSLQISCVVQVDEEALAAAYQTNTAGGTKSREGAAAWGTQSGSGHADFSSSGGRGGGGYYDAAADDYEVLEEEVIEIDPPRPHGGRPKLPSRLPVHQHMTTATRVRNETLDAQFTATVSTLRTRKLNASRPAQIPPPQTLVICVTGRILSEAQVKAGLYIPPREAAAAEQLLAGASWIPPVLQPFYSPPEVAEVDWGSDVDSIAVADTPEDSAAVVKCPGEESAAEAATVALQNDDQVSSSTMPGSLDGQPDDCAQPAAAASTSCPASASASATSTPRVPLDHAVTNAREEAAAMAAAVAATTATAAVAAAAPPQPLRPHPPAQPAPIALLTLRQQAYGAASSILAGLVEELILDPEVLHAFTTLEEEELPVWAQVRASGVPKAYAERLAAAADESTSTLAGGRKSTFMPGAVAACDEGLGDSAEAEEAEETSTSKGDWFTSAVVAVAAKKGEAEAAVMHDPRFQVFAEYVMESALLALVQESAMGDWEDAVEVEGEE